MTPRIFITGGTGLIGGDYLYLITKKYPLWNIAVLVRNPDKAKLVNDVFPGVEIVPGSLDDLELIEQESTKADVVLNCDHESAAQAIIRGLARRKNIGTVIHTSGAKIIAWETEANISKWGIDTPRHYDDWDGVNELTSVPSEEDPEPSGHAHVLPNWAAHRNVDLAILRGFREHPNTVRTAIVCPPTVFGPSRFPASTRSIQLPRLLNVVLKRRRAFTMNGNTNRWNMVHTQDISQLYLLLTEAAVDQRAGELWNENGYYFAECGEFMWGDAIREIARVGFADGLLDSSTPEEIMSEEVYKFWFGVQMNVSSTSLGRSQRAKELLGWSPTKKNILGDIRRAMQDEVELIKSTI